MKDATLILNALEQGANQAAHQLLPAVYRELRQLAAQKLTYERPGHTLQATALVHEAYMRLIGLGGRSFNSRAHFFGAAAEAMRRILIEHARGKHRLKREGERHRVDIYDYDVAIDARSDDLIALDEALDELAKTDPTKAELVKLRYFAGLTLDQAAQVLNISPTTAKRHWNFAKAWLYRRIRG
jgi:RNA polymerase sigma factor (TIGR02999 family)